MVPFSFLALGLAFWKRSLIMGLGVILLMATGKIAWSIYNAGAAAHSIVFPAVAGLAFCLFLIYFGFKKLAKKSST